MKATETKFRSTLYLPGRLFSQLIWCLGALILSCSSASAQNLFAVGVDATGALNGRIDEFTLNGVRSTFASGLSAPLNMAFDESGNLFVADEGTGALYKFTPAGVRTTFALGLPVPVGVAFDSAGNVFATEFGGNIYKFTPNGVRSTFASGLGEPQGLAFDSAGNLFVAVSGEGEVDKFTPDGARTTFASGFVWPFQLAFDSGGNLFVADGGDPWDLVEGAIYKFTPAGLQSTIAPGITPGGLAIDSADNLFVATASWNKKRLSGSILKITPSGVRTTFASRNVGALAFQPTGDSTSPPATTPRVSVSVSASRINRGAYATFTISTSTMNPSKVTTVHYAMSGKARAGVNYTLSGVFGETYIPAGESSATVTLQALNGSMRGRGATATITIMPGTDYTLSNPKRASVTIVK